MMINLTRQTRKWAAVLAGIIAAVSSVDGASLGTNVIVKISGNTGFNISVYPGKASYAGTGGYSGAAGDFGDGTVEAYYFVKNEIPAPDGSSGGSVGTLDRYADDGSTNLSQCTYNGGTGFADMHRGDVWTVSDPGTGFSGGDPADFGGTNETISGAYQVSGSVDVSRYLSGTIYVLCGGYDTPFQVDIVMSGAGQTNLNAGTGSIDPITDRNMYVIPFVFDNASLLYKSVSYAYTGSASNRSRFMGVIVDAERPPSGTVLVIR